MSIATVAETGEIKLIGGKYWIKCKITDEGENYRIKFPFNRPLLSEIKSMAGARWSPETKTWTFTNCERNLFQLAFLAGEKPYDWYDRPLVDMDFSRPLYGHQKDMVRHGFTYRHGIWAAEMGTGKSLSAIEIMERSRTLESRPEWLYVGPRSAIASFELQLREWKSQVIPEIVTYEGLKRLVENWPKGRKAPFGVIFDESSRLKNHTSQRSVAAAHMAASIRRDWPEHSGFVLLMSGSPAPKGPMDWWPQCEIACPGFIKEGTVEKFKARLGLQVMKPSVTGGNYPHHVTWWDDERKCAKCGQTKDHVDHSADAQMMGGHEWTASTNEIAHLYKRMKGLVLVKFKKDCLAELPDKVFRTIQCPPTRATLNAAKLIVAGAATTISGLTLLRELSDGFQYSEEAVGDVTCTVCKGVKEFHQPVPLVDYEELALAMDALMSKADEEGDYGVFNNADGFPIPEHLVIPHLYEMQVCPCPKCDGKGTMTQYKRIAEEVACPKDQALLDLIDQHDEDGRLVIYGGFQGTIDRVVGLVEKSGWEWIRVDGRGWHCSPKLNVRKPVDMLQLFQDKSRQIPRLAFVGHAESAGMGLTLTESCEIVNFSNTFNAEARQQSCDRIHRPGMDLNKGATITDLIHLPSDQLVLDNLNKKKKLQDLSLGSFADALKSMALTTERII